MLIFSLRIVLAHVPSLHLHNMAYVDRFVCTTRRHCRRHRCPCRLVYQINKQQCRCYYRHDDVQDHCV